MTQPLLLEYDGHAPLLADDSFVAPGAALIGRVSLAAGASVWYGSVLRGDNEEIRVGERCNVQDGSILHTDPGHPLILGNEVSMGHGAVVHGSQVEDHVLIGMRATVLNGCRIGSYALVAAGALVRENTVIPARCLVAGVPARVVRDVTEQECELIDRIARSYFHKSTLHRKALEEQLDRRGAVS
jgi:carbonic anhydrase/acetyltransferase-like protein (isoleucine patch superfamily)